ncbi:MAG: hypothetical protein ACLQVK_16765 [Acidimicrobiales bacterium]|jgi:hypothetical protein
MKRALKLLATLTTLSVVLSSALPASGLQTGTKASVASPSSSLKWEASIIPADYMALGNSLPSGPNGDKSGYGLTANGINNWYILCAKGTRCDYRFAIFLFTNAPEKASVTFRVLSPEAKSVYTYTWAADNLPRGSVWFYADATGNFSVAGTYYAEVYGNSTLLGWIPLLFTAR